MATNYPTGLDTLSNPTGTDNLDTSGLLHDAQHANANDAIEALQAKVGINSSTETTSLDYKIKQLSEALVIVCSDEVTALTVGTGKAKFRLLMPTKFIYVTAYVNTAPTGSSLIADVKINGTSIFTTVISIDAGDTNSVSAAAPPVFNSSLVQWGGGEELSVDITQVGSTAAGTGLKVYLYTTRIP